MVSFIGKQSDELKQWLVNNQHVQALEACINAPLLPLSDNFTPPTRMPWGGTNILGKYKQRLPIRPEKRYPIVGESWEISADPISPSQFVFHLGTEEILLDLIQLLDLFPEQILGKKMTEKFSGQNPLLVKIIDAADDLSVQVHPSDDYNGLTPEESGKPESWYVIGAENGGGLYLGLKDGVTKEMLRHALESRGDVSQYLNFLEVQPGDFVVIEAGTIHAIGKGVTVIEPQKIAPRKSGKTYRVWDWNRTYDAQGRLDLHGSPRDLHIEHAFRVINFSGLRGDEFVRHIRPKRRIVQQQGASVETVCVESENFGVSQLVLEHGDPLRGDCRESLHAIIVYEGELEIGTRENRVTRVPCGQSVIVPAMLGEYTLRSSHANAVKVYYPAQYL